ncbi:MAG: J domain-containing protein [Pseudomonadota bacterium]
MNHYETLEVSPKASQEVLKAAYKSLMQRYHPDKNPGDTEAASHSVLVTQAYEILSDAGKRAAYDAELERQQQSQNVVIRERVRYVQKPAPRSNAAYKPHWLLWLIFGLMVVAVGFTWLSSGRKSASAIPAQDTVSPIEEINPPPENSPVGMPQMVATQRELGVGARTMHMFISNVNVNLQASSAYADTRANNVRHVLHIPALSVVVGTFDSVKFLSFLQDNKELINQRLVVNLEKASYELLLKANGSQYLKELILDAIGEATLTNRFDEYPSVGNALPAHYGVVDVMLPESFTVKSTQ